MSPSAARPSASHHQPWSWRNWPRGQRYIPLMAPSYWSMSQPETPGSIRSTWPMTLDTRSKSSTSSSEVSQPSLDQFSLVQNSSDEFRQIQTGNDQFCLVQNNSDQNRPVQPSLAQFRKDQPSFAQFRTVQTSSVQFGPVQKSSAQFSPSSPWILYLLFEKCRQLAP